MKVKQQHNKSSPNIIMDAKTGSNSAISVFDQRSNFARKPLKRLFSINICKKGGLASETIRAQ